MPLGWAIISTGQHPDVKIAPAVAATPVAELVAVYSREQERAAAFAAKHGAKAAYSDLDALLNDQRVAAVFICSPNAQHAIRAALANYVDELRDFRQAIVDNREPAATGLDGLRVVQVTLAMISSAKEGRTVHLEPITV